MRWEGNKIKDLSQTKDISIKKLTEFIGVTRQTVNDWINGQIPKANHLLKICRLFDVEPDYFFSEDSDVILPAHRTRKTAKVNDTMQRESLDLIAKFELLFKNNLNYKIIPVNRLEKKSVENAKKVAYELRAFINITDNRPMDYASTFKLINELGIYIIFAEFTQNIKSYAFYAEINNHRVIFVNNTTKLLDLIFPLLHETVHAIRDEQTMGNSKEEETFCDLVAGLIQFPEEYLKLVYNTISDLTPGAKINKLKNFAQTYGHSLYGIVKNIKEFIDNEFDLKVGASDTKLNAKSHCIGDIIFEQNDVRSYINRLKVLTPNFIELIIEQIDILTESKIAEIFNVGILDAKEIKDVLLSMTEEEDTI